ncbi:glycosyltransferase family 4 protein [Mucilaginibacter flavus]|uniref:glycosyltransferase family 4 protein n=1 Tax=Mucilaginibacter flavus TaxID=931504 RepID=UPI0025B365D7|nr:glycosyltransferase family 4 protein [Mucilaginibacter flavus]MDN3584399.1 glycosyltransferase family 4 protein [Mucilaginibacter flavus]
MSKKVVLFTLQTFSTTGGIQKMARTLAHSLFCLSIINNWNFSLWSVYDSAGDLMPQYLPKENFRGFGLNRLKFILTTLINAGKPEVVILNHINLAIVGTLIKTLNPKCKVWLIAHGIEVWRPLTATKKLLLKRCDKVICVSNYTMQQMISRHHVDGSKCTVLNNAVDPFMKLPESFSKPEYLLKRYGLNEDDRVLFTLTRLASTEQYKGHDQVIKVIALLKDQFPDIKYILSGQYDEKEKKRIERLISDHHVETCVLLTGFIDEGELSDHFLLADLFVLPSKKEGFGIVFIEALACGLPVICGNVDGSIDAVYNSELGTPINPDSLSELKEAIAGYLETSMTEDKRRYLQGKCVSQFNENNYMINLEELIKYG